MLYTSIVAERIGLRRSFAVIMAMSFALNFILAPSKPPPLPSKTFPFIESLFTFFLCNMGLSFLSGDILQENVEKHI